MRLLLLFFIIILPSLSSASSEIYTWKDKNGITHFSENKPAYQAQITLVNISTSHKPLPDNEIVASSKKLGDEKLAPYLPINNLRQKLRIE